MVGITVENIQDYVKSIRTSLDQGNATEHTYRPALKTLIESYGSRIQAVNEPKRVACGAPDFFVTRDNTPIGHIETKDLSEDLDKAEKTEQLERYLASLSNLILTNYCEFRWYVDGKERFRAQVAWIDRSGKLIIATENFSKLISHLMNFLEFRHQIISSPKDLAIRMAKQARMIRDSARALYDLEPSEGQLHEYLSIFRETLVPDLSIGAFCDMFAQTVSYGLFAAKSSNAESEILTREKAGFLVPKTNPFLRKFFNELAGPDLDESIAWALDDLVTILNQSHMEKIKEEFLKKREGDDAVIHFYETFLNEYNPKERVEKGVFYTPFPVVSFIVRSVDKILKNQFNCNQGIADPATIKVKHEEQIQTYHRVLILDPACGTGTFLSVIIDLLRDSFRNNEGMFSSYVEKHLIPRLYGFELLMAPYAIAHIKVGLRLSAIGYNFASDERLRIFLTNTLDDPMKKSEVLFSNWVSKEGNWATEVKREYPIMVIVGNPPYSGVSANKGKWITDLIDDYRYVGKEKIKEKKSWLQDDYVKFIRFSQWKIERTGQGIIGFITNGNWLDGPTFRGMRYNLLDQFDEIRILNLHGSAKREDARKSPEKDENVFDIMQGVAVFFLIRKPGSTNKKVLYQEITGSRETKYSYLLDHDIDSINWQELNPQRPHYLLVPRVSVGNEAYDSWDKITDIFQINSIAIQSSRDSLAFAFSRDEMVKRMNLLRNPAVSTEEIRRNLNVRDMSFWKLEHARDAIQKDSEWTNKLFECLYRPFDKRIIYYSTDVIHRPRQNVMRHLLKRQNIALLAPRQLSSQEFLHVMCTDVLSEMCVISTKTKEQNYVFPLYIYSKKGDRLPNLKTEYMDMFARLLNLKLLTGDRGDLEKTIGSYDIFAYIYGILHCTTYRKLNYDSLKYDFARIPPPPNLEFFKKIRDLGDKLIHNHLEWERSEPSETVKFPNAGSNKVEVVEVLPSQRKNSLDIVINRTQEPIQLFTGVQSEVWNYRIGSFRVLERWLKERKNRILSFDELTLFLKIVASIERSIEIMDELDNVFRSQFN